MYVSKQRQGQRNQPVGIESGENPKRSSYIKVFEVYGLRDRCSRTGRVVIRKPLMTKKTETPRRLTSTKPSIRVALRLSGLTV
jgi:hypothetical protein